MKGRVPVLAVLAGAAAAVIGFYVGRLAEDAPSTPSEPLQSAPTSKNSSPVPTLPAAAQMPNLQTTTQAETFPEPEANEEPSVETVSPEPEPEPETTKEAPTVKTETSSPAPPPDVTVGTTE